MNKEEFTAWAHRNPTIFRNAIDTVTHKRYSHNKDLVGELYLRCYENAANYDPSKGTIEAWVFNRARSIWCEDCDKTNNDEHYKQEGFERSLMPLLETHEAPTSDWDVCSRLCMEDDILRIATDREIEYINLRLEGLKWNEIKNHFGVTDTAIVEMVSRMRKKFKKKFEQADV